jgi:hypothetical protein
VCKVFFLKEKATRQHGFSKHMNRKHCSQSTACGRDTRWTGERSTWMPTPESLGVEYHLLEPGLCPIRSSGSSKLKS